jgi:hypothetical protein
MVTFLAGHSGTETASKELVDGGGILELGGDFAAREERRRKGEER